MKRQRSYRHYDLMMAVFVTVLGAQFVAKVGVEVVFTPVTYKIVAWLKKAENEDYYDRNTDFNPFHLSK